MNTQVTKVGAKVYKAVKSASNPKFYTFQVITGNNRVPFTFKKAHKISGSQTFETAKGNQLMYSINTGVEKHPIVYVFPNEVAVTVNHSFSGATGDYGKFDMAAGQIHPEYSNFVLHSNNTIVIPPVNPPVTPPVIHPPVIHLPVNLPVIHPPVLPVIHLPVIHPPVLPVIHPPVTPPVTPPVPVPVPVVNAPYGYCSYGGVCYSLQQAEQDQAAQNGQGGGGSSSGGGGGDQGTTDQADPNASNGYCADGVTPCGESFDQGSSASTDTNAPYGYCSDGVTPCSADGVTPATAATADPNAPYGYCSDGVTPCSSDGVTPTTAATTDPNAGATAPATTGTTASTGMSLTEKILIGVGVAAIIGGVIWKRKAIMKFLHKELKKIEHKKK